MTAQYSTVIQTHSKARIIALAIGLVLVVPLMLFGFLMVQGALTRASDEAPQSVVVTGITKSTATIQWVTDRESQGMIEYGTTPGDLNQFAPEAATVIDHEVKLTLLSPATTYYFRIRVGDTSHDNAGVPWSFTTKTITGEDVTPEVQGVADEVKNLLLSPKPSTSAATLMQCESLTCDQIRGYLGKGCTARDYVQCISKSTSVTPPPGGVLPTVPSSMISPTPTTAVITSNTCALSYIQPNTCTAWSWDTMKLKYPACQNAFSYYQVECTNNTFGPTPGVTNAPMVRYFNDAIDDIEMNYVYLPGNGYPTPAPGTNVHCRVRAVDKTGASTAWVYNNKACE